MPHCEKSYFAEADKYEGHFKTVGFVPERGNRYMYYASPGAPMVCEPRSDDGPAVTTTCYDVDTFRYPDMAAEPIASNYSYCQDGGCSVIAAASSPPMASTSGA